MASLPFLPPQPAIFSHYCTKYDTVLHRDLTTGFGRAASHNNNGIGGGRAAKAILDT